MTAAPRCAEQARPRRDLRAPEAPEIEQREADEEEVAELLALAEQVEGIVRNVGMHAGGVLIAPGKITDFCPLYMQPGSDSAVSQFDKDDVEAIGLVKFDFLGLATLTILELAKDFIVARHPEQRRLRLRDARRSTTRRSTGSSPKAGPNRCSSSKAAACSACCATPSRTGSRT